MSRHISIPVFIPHLGCPNQCVFCNQKRISGAQSFSLPQAEETICAALETAGAADEVQIAFFGGSFTGIPRAQMMELLKLGSRFVSEGRVSSLRLSTRPDYIDEEILAILKRHGVKTIELGIQSMSDAVLLASRRGHTAERSRAACGMIVKHGFELVGQMMIGLPGSAPEDEVRTAREICALGAHCVRIYPTVVFEDTVLAELARAGRYAPLCVDEAVRRSTLALEQFAACGVPVIRIGLQSSEALVRGEGIYTGAAGKTYHEAMGELCYGEYFRRRFAQTLAGQNPAGKTAQIYVAPRSVSRAAGLNARNKRYLQETFGLCAVKIYAQSDMTELDYKILLTERGERRASEKAGASGL